MYPFSRSLIQLGYQEIYHGTVSGGIYYLTDKLLLRFDTTIKFATIYEKNAEEFIIYSGDMFYLAVVYSNITVAHSKPALH
jgi:hypothetical protein